MVLLSAKSRGVGLQNKEEHSPFILCKTKYFRARKVGTEGS